MGKQVNHKRTEKTNNIMKTQFHNYLKEQKLKCDNPFYLLNRPKNEDKNMPPKKKSHIYGDMSKIPRSQLKKLPKNKGGKI